jgi:hypothetical protein
MSRRFVRAPITNAFPPSALMLDGIVVAAAFVVIAVAVVRAFAEAVAFVARASARAVDFSPHWRSASCIVDALYPAAAGVFAAVDLAFSPYLPAVFDTSDLASYFRYSAPPDADTREDLSDAPGYWCAHRMSQPCQPPLRSRYRLRGR